MDFLELVRTRRSIRAYQDRPVEEEKLTRILEAARLAPSWANKQCWSFVVVRDGQLIEEVAKSAGIGHRFLRDAPVIVAVCADPVVSGHRNDMDYFLVDAAITMEHLVLAATELELGTCWIVGFDENKVKAVLGVPIDQRVVALTPVGYPGDDGGLGNRLRKAVVGASERKPMEELVHWDRW